MASVSLIPARIISMADNEEDVVVDSDAISIADNDEAPHSPVFPVRSSSGTQHDGSSCPCRGRSRLLSVIVIVAIGLFGMVTAIVVVLHFTGILKHGQDAVHKLTNKSVVGGWQKWSPWSGCSITCGGGQQSRNRSCDSPRPSNSGIICTGATEETQACNTGHCPVNGSWGEWSSLTVFCCGGKQRRYRACNNPPPEYGGAICIGDGEVSYSCIKENCPEDCSGYIGIGLDNGVYRIVPNKESVDIPVFCEFSSDGVWTVIQRRFDGSENFYRPWRDYKAGFGTARAEYWLGNDRIHDITTGGNYRLTIRLTDWDNVTKYANYSTFQIADESNEYCLRASDYSGDAGDSLWHHNGEHFSTVDVENDISTQRNCAWYRHGAWWYSNCGQSNLNGAYHSTASAPSETGIFWYHWHGWRYSLKATTLMIQNKTG